MEEQEWLAREFEDNRSRLKRVALRMLGSESEADDAVQEAWLRLSRSDAGAIDNLAGWLTTVVARICLDMLRLRKSRAVESLDADESPEVADGGSIDPEREAILAESMGPALLVVLDLLTPPERVAFVLHDMFGMPFEEIAPIIGRSLAASRQLASRARRRVRGSTEEAAAHVGPRRTERRIVDAFLSAARGGRFEELLTLLDPDCVVRADDFAAAIGAPRLIEGGTKVADFFNGAASSAIRTSIGGVPGAGWALGGKLRVAFRFSFRDDTIAGIELIGDQKRLRELGVVLLPASD